MDGPRSGKRRRIKKEKRTTCARAVEEAWIYSGHPVAVIALHYKRSASGAHWGTAQTPDRHSFPSPRELIIRPPLSLHVLVSNAIQK